MPHAFAVIDCKHCGKSYCPACKEVCPNCGKDGILNVEHRKHVELLKLADKKRRINQN